MRIKVKVWQKTATDSTRNKRKMESDVDVGKYDRGKTGRQLTQEG